MRYIRLVNCFTWLKNSEECKVNPNEEYINAHIPCKYTCRVYIFVHLKAKIVMNACITLKEGCLYTHLPYKLVTRVYKLS